MKRAAREAAAALVTAAALCLAGCAAPVLPSPSAAQPSGDGCGALMESLNAAVPPGQSLAELQARGVRVRTPLSFPPGSVPRPQRSSGAAVQLMIQPDGRVLPGSATTVKSIGEPQIAAAMEAGALSMGFDFDGIKPTQPIPFTTTFAVCVQP